MLNWLSHLFISIAVFVGLAQAPQPTAPVIETPVAVVATSTEVASKPAIDWKCRVVIGCNSADWRYASPEDECTYTSKIIRAVNNPVELASYGGSCVPYQPEQEKVRYEPTPPVISSPSVAPVLAPALPPSEPRTYTNERGQITTEDGTVLWSPPTPSPAPQVAPQAPTTTPDEPVSTDPYPCLAGQPWTCRPSAAQQSGHTCTLTTRSGATYQAWCAY